MACIAGAETTETPALDHECMHTYIHIDLVYMHQPTTLAISLITVT